MLLYTWLRLEAVVTSISREVNLEVTKQSFYFTGVMNFNTLPHHIKETFNEFPKDTKDFFLS